MKKHLALFVAIIAALAVQVAPAQAACTPISIGFPSTLDVFSTGTCVPSAWANVLEPKMGINGSAVTSSLDYQINHIFTSYGSEIIASSALPWLPASLATTTITAGSSTASGPAFTFATSTASGKWNVAASGTVITYTLPSNVGFFTNDAGYLTANQSITWTGSGDVSGSASGATSLSPSITVTGLNGKALPSLTQGVLLYTGSAWSLALPLGSAYGGTATTTALGANAFTSGGFPSIATTSPTIYDNAPTATDDIPFRLRIDATTTLQAVYCDNDNATGTFLFNITWGTTRFATTSNAFTAAQSCTATTTVATLTPNGSTTIPIGSVIRMVLTGATSTAATVQIDY